jgi:hypothetical protein
MATQPIIPELPPHLDLDEGAPRLSREEGWKLIRSMFGTAKEMYAEVGGSDAFMHQERAAWDDKDEYR